MTRPRLNIINLEKKYKDVEDCLQKGNIFVCQFEQGTCVLIDKQFNMIMYNPHSEVVTSAEIPKETLIEIYNSVFISDPEYQFFMVESNGHGAKELFAGITEALMCLKSGDSYGGYKIKKDTLN